MRGVFVKNYPVIKPVLDCILALMGICILWPLLLLIAVLIKLESQGPVFFKQKRVGKNKREFYILKFRTMRTDAPQDMPTHMLENSEAFITKMGGILRKTSLDELPQIINILVGEMSIVGPRPALWNQYDLIAERDGYGANDIYPGLTGWAQINGRDELTIDVKARYDGEYVEKMSFGFDVEIFFKTLFGVLQGRGVQEGRAEQDSMKIMILSSYAPTLFFFREDMMTAMLGNGHEVVAAAPEGVEEWTERFAQQNIHYVQIDVDRTGKNPFKDIGAFFSILHKIIQEKPDKIFAYQAKTVVYGCIAAKFAGVSEVYAMIGGLGSVFRNGNKKSLAKSILKIEYKAAFKCCKKVFFHNPDDSKVMTDLEIIDENKVVLINGSGVNLLKFTPKAMPLKPVFLLVGRIIRDKGIIEYLAAAKIVKDNYPEARFQLVGYFDTNPTAIKEEEIQGYVDEGTIEYLGPTDDVRPYLEKCSVYVLPSYHEGTPKSVLEAMATGRPIITTDAPGCRETVIDGVNGFLVPVKNVGILAEKMIWMIEHQGESEKMAQASLRLCQEKFDVNKVNEVILTTMGLTESNVSIVEVD